jgi:hypothetical protein
MDPHRKVHEAGRKALAALTANDVAAARHHVATMREQSGRILRGLDEFGCAYLATVGAAQPPSTGPGDISFAA